MNMGVLRTDEGYIRIPARIARTGIQDYYVAELRRAGVPISAGVPSEAIVRVYRPGGEVFNDAALRSFEYKPLTIGHPDHLVTPSTLAQDMAGLTLSPVAVQADKRHVGVEVQIMSDAGVAAYERGVRQLSCGYTSEIKMTPGVTDAGEPFDAVQTSIKGNHVALVERGRAGSARLEDTSPQGENQMTAEEQKRLDDALAAVAALTKEKETLQGSVAALEKSQVTDEEMQRRIAEGITKARQADKERAAIVDKALKCAPKMQVVDAMSTADVMRAAIKAQLGDIDLTGRSDDYVRGVFDNLKAAGDVPRDAGTSPVFDSDKPALTFDDAKRLAWG